MIIESCQRLLKGGAGGGKAEPQISGSITALAHKPCAVSPTGLPSSQAEIFISWSDYCAQLARRQLPMEWSSKMPTWDLADLEQSAELNLGSLVGPSFVLGSQSGGLLDCSVDLKLGGLGDFRQPESWGNRQPSATMAEAVTAVPSKRTRAGGNGGLGASCLVDGCKSDLSNSREYHRRHKVCEVHSKSPIVMVGGQEQRFCQQCSRFHQLVEFDEVKRSCRKRLDGHNRRRRKPQPESINPGSGFPNNPGSRFLMYPYLSPTPTQSHSWSGVIDPEDTPRRAPLPLHAVNGQQSAARNIKQFIFLQDDNSAFGRPQTTLQPFLETISAKSSSCNRILAERSPTQVFNSDCALSLLSSAQDIGVGVGQMLPAGRIPIHQSLVSGLHFANAAQASGYVSAATGFSCSTAGDEQVGNVFICGAEAGLHCQGSVSLLSCFWSMLIVLVWLRAEDESANGRGCRRLERLRSLQSQVNTGRWRRRNNCEPAKSTMMRAPVAPAESTPTLKSIRG